MYPRTMRWIGFAMVCTVGVAHADDVNLLTNAPATIAVSSTVANAAIVPDHIADGKLSTAWNSKTGELVGAWVAVRVPADAKVKAIKLTAGFAHKDKTGDLFTMNPRIKKVRISQGRKASEHVLDIENRGLQTINVDLAGGDLEVKILEIVPGSKANWKEACISELEVWGSVAKPAKAKPVFRIGGLDAAATITREQCIKALFPTSKNNRIGPDKDDEAIVDVVVTPVNEQFVVCSVDHKGKDSTSMTHAYGAVKRLPKPALVGTKLEPATEHEENKREPTGKGGHIKIEVVPLTTSEQGVLVHVTQTAHGPMMSDRDTESTLYRVTSSGLDDVLSWKSTFSGGEADSGDECELELPKPGKYMPSRLVLECTVSKGDWHNDDIDKRGMHTKTRKERFVWKNGSYEPK